jgi:two-component system, chemotaxis family, response regulator WspR
VKIPGSHAMQILIVTSDPSVGDMARERLPAIGGDLPLVVATLDEALCAARGLLRELDVIVLDLDIAGVDCLAACRRLSTLLADVPIVACSKQDDDDTLTRAFDAGARDFIRKPMRDTEFTLRIKAALQLRVERVRRAQYEQRLVQWVHQLEKSKRDLESTVRVDPLTGVANRRHFDTVLRTEWRRAARDQTSLSVVFFDLDDFHAFNDRYGHVGGDACLARVADALARGLRRASDVMARYGGEEFVAVLPDTDANGACVVAERLRARIEELAIPHSGSRCSRVVTLSVGIASCIPAASSTPETLVEAADAAMFRAKADGRNCCRADGVDAAAITIRREPWPTCPVVVLDPILVERVPRFLDSVRAELASLEVLETDTKQLSISTSRIRRAADSLGLKRVVELAKRIDEAMRSSDLEAASELHEQLGWYLQHVQVVYRRAALKAV